MHKPWNRRGIGIHAEENARTENGWDVAGMILEGLA
jgi:hypothetical protein